MKDVTKFIIENLQEKVDVSVYFKEDAPEEGILQIKDEIAKIPEVKSVEYISRVEALDRFIQRYKNNPVVIESLNEVGNPLLSALNIKAWQANQYTAVTSFLENVPQKDLIEKVDYYQRKPVIDRIFSITAAINIIGISLFIILATIAVLVTFNQIRLSIYNSREEIGVQRLVGASNWFIRGPFLFQGVISGLFAAIATFFIFGLAVFLLSPKFAILFSGLNIFHSFLSGFWLFLLIQIFTGITLGVLSSIIAIRKYLEI